MWHFSGYSSAGGRLLVAAVLVLVVSRNVLAFEFSGYCQKACMWGRGGNLCKCSTAHFAGKRDDERMADAGGSTLGVMPHISAEEWDDFIRTGNALAAAQQNGLDGHPTPHQDSQPAGNVQDEVDDHLEGYPEQSDRHLPPDAGQLQLLKSLVDKPFDRRRRGGTGEVPDKFRTWMRMRLPRSKASQNDSPRLV